jgi:hypothetical protein
VLPWPFAISSSHSCAKQRRVSTVLRACLCVCACLHACVAPV